MRILHAGIFDDHELGGDIIFERGLRQNGCDVERFDYRKVDAKLGNQEMLNRLVQRASDKDMLFVGKGELLSDDALRAIRRKGVKTVLWYGDIRRVPEPWLLRLLGEVDYFFMSSGGKLLEEHFVKGKPRLAAYYFNPADPDLVGKYRDLPRCTRDIVFTGSNLYSAAKERKKTIEYLKERGDVAFWGGASEPSNVFSRARRRLFHTMPRCVRGSEYVAVIKSARIGIGVSYLQDVPKYTSDRLSHYLTFGTFFLAWRFPEVERLFAIGKELVCFEGTEELDSKIQYYLSNPEEREAIALAGQRRITAEYNCRNITGMMLDIIQTGKSERFPWVEVLK